MLGSEYDAEFHQWKELLCIGQQDYNVSYYVFAPYQELISVSHGMLLILKYHGYAEA